MSEALGNLLERRSIRAYKPEQISEDELQSVLKAGLLAPSAMNRQPTAMLVVQDKDTISLLSKLNAKVMGKDIDPFYGAPTVIVVLADRNVPTYIEDGALVLGNLMNARKCRRARLVLGQQSKGSVRDARSARDSAQGRHRR